MSKVQRPLGLVVAGLSFLVCASALVIEILDAERPWTLVCLAMCTAYVALTAAGFARASRDGNSRQQRSGILVVLPLIWVLLIILVNIVISDSFP